MSKKTEKFKFPAGKQASVINYDLSKYGSISASAIAMASDGKLYDTMTVDGILYNLPNTTLWGWLTRDEAEKTFIKAFNEVKDKEVLTRLLIVELDDKNVLILNDE